MCTSRCEGDGYVLERPTAPPISPFRRRISDLGRRNLTAHPVRWKRLLLWRTDPLGLAVQIRSPFSTRSRVCGVGWRLSPRTHGGTHMAKFNLKLKPPKVRADATTA